jgi:hypothetical protein
VLNPILRSSCKASQEQLRLQAWSSQWLYMRSHTASLYSCR